MLRVASSRALSGAFALSDLGYRAYIRHAADLPVVREVVSQRVGAAPVAYVQADVCRADLLVEIEGQALRPLPV